MPVAAGGIDARFDAPRGSALAGLGKVVQTDPAGPGAGGDDAAAVDGVGGLRGQGGDDAAHADAAALGQMPLRRDRLDAQEGLLTRAADVELGEHALAAGDEVRAGGGPEQRAGREEGLGGGPGQGVGGGGGVPGRARTGGRLGREEVEQLEGEVPA